MAITAGCSTVDPYGAVIIGAGAGPVFCLAKKYIKVVRDHSGRPAHPVAKPADEAAPASSRRPFDARGPLSAEEVFDGAAVRRLRAREGGSHGAWAWACVLGTVLRR